MINNQYNYISEIARQVKVDNLYNANNSNLKNTSSQSGSKKDTIELSINSNFDLARAEKINSLKGSITNGDYSINSKIIATAMIENLKTLK